MLHDFIAANRDAIIARTKGRVGSPAVAIVSTHELEGGLPVFLTQIAETLRLESTDTPFPASAIGAAAARHGAELLREGFDVLRWSTAMATSATRSPRSRSSEKARSPLKNSIR